MAVGQQRPDPKRLPGERQIALVIYGGAFEVLARNLQLRVIKEDLPLTRVQQPARIGLLPDPADKLVQQFAQSADTFLRLFAQPLTDLGLISKLADAEQLQSQRIIIQRFAIRQTTARAQRVNQLTDNHLGAIATLLILARIQTGELAHLFPEPKPPRHRFHRDQTSMNRLICIGDKLQLQPSLFLVNRRHWFCF